jgi:hypothetical protein
MRPLIPMADVKTEATLTPVRVHDRKRPGVIAQRDAGGFQGVVRNLPARHGWRVVLRHQKPAWPASRADF